MHHQNKILLLEFGNFFEGGCFGSGPMSQKNAINSAIFRTWISVWVICMYNSTVSTLLKDFTLSIHVI